MQNKKIKTVITILAVIVAVVIILLLLAQCGKQEPVVESTGTVEGGTEIITDTPPAISETNHAASSDVISSTPVETLPTETEDSSMSSEDIEASSDIASDSIVGSEDDPSEHSDSTSVLATSGTQSVTTEFSTQTSTIAPTVAPTTSQAPTTVTPTVPPTAPTTKATTPVSTTPTPTTPVPTTPVPTVHSHSFGDWVVLRTPTCTSLGLQRKTCSCGAWHEESIPKSNDHEWITEQILVRAAWDEQVLVKEAWEEEIEVYNWVLHMVCKGCEDKGTLFFLDLLSDDEWYDHDTAHIQAGEEFGFYDKPFYEYIRTDIIFHPPVYETVYHPAEYTTVHHEAEYATVEKCKNCGRFK